MSVMGEFSVGLANWRNGIWNLCLAPGQIVPFPPESELFEGFTGI